jgi:hypothetical protein
MPKVYKCQRKLNKGRFNVQIPEEVITKVMNIPDITQCVKEITHMGNIQRKKVYTAALREVKRRRFKNMATATMREPVMTFEEFCKPLDEVGLKLKNKGIDSDEFSKRKRHRDSARG